MNSQEPVYPLVARKDSPYTEDFGCVWETADGDLHDLVDALVESGVQVLNFQDMANGNDWIKNKFKGRLCIELDIDHQDVTQFGTPEQIDKLIKNEVVQLGSRADGSLMSRSKKADKIEAKNK